ncbi:MAG: hypothetical protein ACJAVZ_005190 [Afipia broomeae]|jgi:hypothetical protein
MADKMMIAKNRFFDMAKSNGREKTTGGLLVCARAHDGVAAGMLAAAHKRQNHDEHPGCERKPIFPLRATRRVLTFS